MHFSDYEFGLAVGAANRIRAIETESATARTRMSQHVSALSAELSRLRSELRQERAMRMSLQLENDRLNRVLDTPIDDLL